METFFFNPLSLDIPFLHTKCNNDTFDRLGLEKNRGSSIALDIYHLGENLTAYS